MCKFLQMPWGRVLSYDFWINIGSVIGSIGLIISIYTLTKNRKDTLLIFVSMFAVMCLGAFPARAVRGLTHGNVESLHGLLELFWIYPGSHFIGRVLLCVILYPVCFRLLFKQYAVWCGAMMDRYCMFFIFQHIFNRIACFYNGCCIGKYYDGIFALQYTVTGSGAGYSYPVYPAVVFECISMMLLFIICLVLLKKKKKITGIFEVSFGLVIFLSEFMMNHSGTIQIAGLTIVQYAALLLVLIGIHSCRYIKCS